MSTPADPQTERAERAFRTAFGERAEGLSAASSVLIPSAAEPRLRRRWVVAIAAVVAVIAGSTAAGLMLRGEGGTDVTDPAAVGGLPAPAPGQRWVSWRNVAVQVPDDWDYGHEPGEDWCASDGEDEQGRGSYVTLEPGLGVVLSIGCPATGESHDEAFGPAPERLWRTHLALETAMGEPDLALTDGPWTLRTRKLGEVRVRLLTDDAASAETILDSALQFDVDQSGCAPSSPIQGVEFVRPQPFDVTQISDVDRISVCEYQRGLPLDEPALMASASLTGGAADALLKGLQVAPAGGGPDRPRNCLPDAYGETGIAVHLHHDSRVDTVFVYFDNCFGNGSDDGTVRRELTVQTCSPLFVPPVTAWSYSSHLSEICG